MKKTDAKSAADASRKSSSARKRDIEDKELEDRVKKEYEAKMHTIFMEKVELESKILDKDSVCGGGFLLLMKFSKSLI